MWLIISQEMATHPSILASWTEEPGRLQFTGSQRVVHNSVTEHKSIKLLSYVCVCVQCIVTWATLKTRHSGWWPLTLHTLLGRHCPPWMTQLPLVVWWLLNSSCSCLSPEFKFIWSNTAKHFFLGAPRIPQINSNQYPHPPPFSPLVLLSKNQSTPSTCWLKPEGRVSTIPSCHSVPTNQYPDHFNSPLWLSWVRSIFLVSSVASFVNFCVSYVNIFLWFSLTESETFSLEQTLNLQIWAQPMTVNIPNVRHVC